MASMLRTLDHCPRRNLVFLDMASSSTLLAGLFLRIWTTIKQDLTRRRRSSNKADRVLFTLFSLFFGPFFFLLFFLGAYAVLFLHRSVRVPLFMFFVKRSTSR